MTAGTTDDFFVETSAAASSPPAEPSPAPAPAASPAPEAVPPSSLPSEPTEAPETGAEAEDEPDPAASEAGRVLSAKSQKAKERIQQLTREKWDQARAREAAEAEAERLRRELESFRRQSQAGVAAAPQTTSTVEPLPGMRPRPRIEDFSDFNEHQAADVEWLVEYRLAIREREAAERKAKEYFEQVMSAHTARVSAYREQQADYDQVMARAVNLPVSPAMEQIIIESDHGPALAYHLAQHPDECDRIARLSPIAAAKAMGALETEIRTANARPARTQAATVTRATPPIRPVGGSAIVATPPPELIDDLDEYVRVNNAEERRRQQEGLRR